MRSLFKRSIALLLFLALILPYCNVLPMASAVTENWKFHGDYTDVAVIKDSNSSPSMQGLAVGSQMLYAIKIKTDNSRAVITMTDKDSGTTTTLKDASTGYSYFTGLDHANDMAVWGIDGSSHIFVATTLQGSNAIVRYRRSGSNLYKVATYHLKCNGSDICATAMDVMNVDSSGNIHLITKWGQDIYTGTVHKDTGDTTVNMTKICTISKDMAYIRGEKLNLSEWTNQGFGYYDNTLFVPLSGPQEGANIALHRSVVLVYNLDNVPQGATIYPTDYLAFRVTSEYYSALFEIESVDICSSDGKLYFNTNRRRSNSDTNHDGISSFDEYTYTKPAAASFDAVKHFNAKFLPNGGSGTMEVQRINNGISTPLSKNLYTKPGYTFVGWTAHRLAQNQWYYCTDRSTTGWYAEGKQPSGYSLYIYYDQQKVSATSNVHADTVEYVAQWTPTNYTVKFDANGGTGSVSDMTFTVEQTKTLPANGFTKTGYTFKGWQISGQSTILQPGTSAAELAKYVGTDSNITLVANWEANNYTVTWNVDGQKYATTNVAYGQPITAPSYTAPEGYTFSGWTVPATMPAKDLTLDATLTVNKYTITFKDEDGDVLKSGKVAYGDMPTAPADPTKKPDGHYTYSFAGWTPEITKVTGEATYTATYKETENSYYIVGSMNNWTAAEDNKMSRVTDDVYSLTMALPMGTYEYKANIGNWDICWPGGDNQTIEVPYDTEVTFTLNRLTGELTAKYALKIALAGDFNNWNQQAYMTDNGDGTYTSVLDLTAKTYQFKIIDETVWKGNNGTIVDTTTTTSAVGWVMDQNQNNCKLKASGGTYTFTYNTNTDSLVITYEPAKYTITFVDDDGNELSEQTVTAGQMPKIPADPTKAETAEYTYEFTGWTPEIVAATGDATYTAQFKATPKSYTITYMVDGVKVHEDTYAYGANVTAWSYTAAEGYTFSGWDTEIPATMPAENLTITGTTSIKSYTITYMVDGVKVHEDTYAYGANVTAWSYTPDEGYTFSGWDAEIPATMPAENLTINGTLKRTIHIVTYYIDNAVDDEEGLYYGETYLITGIIPEKEGFAFKGWDKDQDGTPDYQPDEEIIIKSDLKLHAVFDPLYKIYFNYADESGQTVTWSIFYGEMDEVIQLDTMNWWNYANFIGWDVDGDGEADYEGEAAYTIKGDQTMVAVFEPFYVDLDLGAEDAVYVDAEGNDITRIYMENEHRNSVTLTNFPTRTGYTFLGWSVEEPYSGTSESLVCVNEETGKPEVTLVLGSNATATAIWEAIDYKLTFTINGQVYSESNAHYGDAIGAPAYEIPEGHTFSGWTLPETMPAEDITLDAALTVNSYTVTFKVDGEFYKTASFEYGAAVEAPDYDAPVGYNFSGWTLPETMPAEDITLNATLTPKTYTVTWLDEAENVFATETVKHGENAINVPDVPEKEGYTGAWSADAVNVTSDLTIKPVYTAVEYTLILLPGEGAEGERVTKTFTIELDESIPDDENSFSKVGHYQNYWWLSGKETGNMNDIIGSEYHYKDLVQFSDENNTVTLVARWNRMFYSTYVLLPDDTVDRHDLTYGKPLAEQEAFFERVLRDKLIRDGYTFTGWKWYEDVAETKVYTGTTMPAYSLYAVAQWEANTYTVTWYYGEGEQLQETYAYGATVNGFIPERFCIDTKTHRGWFDHDWWYIQGNTSDRIELPFTMPAENLEICSATKFTGWMGGPDQSFFNYNIDYSSLSGWFCVNDKNELVTDGSGEWYYAGSDRNVVCGVNRAPYPTQLGYGPDQGDPDQANSLFIFDESGVFQSEYTGLCELDGKTAYAVNGELPWYAGLVEVDGEYYYFGEDRTMVKGQNLELNKTNDMIFDNGAAAVKSGTYTFDENGKLCKYDGIVRIDGKLFEYEDYRLIREIKAKLCFASLSLNGNIAINYYMLLSDEVLNDDTAYMQFTLVDGEVIRIPVSQGVETLYEGETYYRFSCMVNAKEMTDDIISQFFYEDGSTAEYTYNVQTYAKYILENSEDADMKELAKAMLHYGGASQIHFGYNTDDIANAGMEEPDYADVTIEGFETVTGQGTDLVKFHASSLLLKSETTLRFFFKVDSSVENLTVTFNGQSLEIKQRSGLYYADVVGIAAKDLDENVTVTISDGVNTADVTFNPMAYCQLVQNDTAGTFSQNMKIVAKALYLYNLAANKYFKEN